jgi:hypothetical protein
MKLTVEYVNPAAGKEYKIAPGDILWRVNNVRPQGNAHALSLFDRGVSEGLDCHTCVIVRHGFGRIGRVLSAMFGLTGATVLMLLYEMGYLSTENDKREL